MADTANTYASLQRGYQASDCEYQELNNGGRDTENVYDVANTPTPAAKGCNKSTDATVDRHKASQAGKTTAFKCLVATLVIVTCVAVISLMTAITALVIAVKHHHKLYLQLYQYHELALVIEREWTQVTHKPNSFCYLHC